MEALSADKSLLRTLIYSPKIRSTPQIMNQNWEIIHTIIG